MIKILVADDDTVMLGLLSTLMDLEGYQVETVTRPEEIIPAVERIHPSLILMDYHLAGGDVMDTLVELKGRGDLCGIPVVVASGMDRERVCLEAGASDFILKPFRPAQLLARIREVLGSCEH